MILFSSCLRLFDSVVTPTMLSGSGSWVVTTVRAQKIRTTQRKMMRAVLGKVSLPSTDVAPSVTSMMLGLLFR